jgi:hypothetical protein
VPLVPAWSGRAGTGSSMRTSTKRSGRAIGPRARSLFLGSRRFSNAEISYEEGKDIKITVACIAFGIGVCFRCVHVPSVAHAMFAAVLVIAMTPSVGLKGGLLIYEGPSLTRVQNDHSHLNATYLQSPDDLHRPLRTEEREIEKDLEGEPNRIEALQRLVAELLISGSD